MSRASTSVLGAVAKSATTPRLARSFRTIPGARPPKAGSAGQAVDYRIFQGIDGFLGEKEFSRLNEWQGGLWERLQAEVNNNPRLAEIKQKWDRSGLDMADLLTTSSRDPQLSLAFNYASLLMNNSFFLEGLHRDSAKPVPSEFRALEEKVSNYANGITGGGWLWLVRSNTSQLDVDIVPTFAAGTLLVSNRAQRGRNDASELYLEPEASSPESKEVSEPEPEIASDPNSPTEVPPTLSTPPRSRFSVGREARQSQNTWPVPLAVLNLYELAYMGEKYGVWGKKQYAADWWRSLNWEEIVRRNARAQ